MSKKVFFKPETINFFSARSRDVICFFTIGLLSNFLTLIMLNFGERIEFLLPILFINTSVSFFVAFGCIDTADDFKAAVEDLDEEEKNSASGKRLIETPWIFFKVILGGIFIITPLLTIYSVMSI